MDFTYLAAQCLGDRALERDLLELFVKQARRVIDSLPGRTTLEQDEAAHLLKGSARAVGAVAVADAAASYERATKRGPDTLVYRDLSATFRVAEATIAAHLARSR